MGLPCTTWGNAGRTNGGTRRKDCPYGSGALEREHMGNKQWKDAVRLIEALVAAGGCFTMENPQTSCLWWSREMDQLSRLTPCKLVTFTQCAYDLRPPAAQAYEYFPKITSVFGNLNDLHVLERRCPGKRPCHSHVAACGSRKVRGKHVSLAKATGRYPPKLCASLAKVVLISLQRGPSHVFRRFDSHSCGLFSSLAWISISVAWP